MEIEFEFDEFDNVEVDASLHNNETGMIDYVLLDGNWVDCATGEIILIH